MPHKTILLIDDDENVRSTMEAILLQAGYRVVSTRLDCNAIESLIDNRFDLVLMDLKMRDKEGFALLSNLHIVYPEIPVMVLTSYSAMDIAKEAEHLGARGYLFKPVDPTLLLGQIKEILLQPETTNIDLNNN